MTERDVEWELWPWQPDQADPADDLLGRIAAARRAGTDTARDVEDFLAVAGNDNRAALDRLAT